MDDCTPPPAVRTFGEAVFRHRIRLQLAQAAVAAAARMASSYYSQVENGKRAPPKRVTAMRIVQALRLPADEAAQLLALAESERAKVTTDAHLDEPVRLLLADIRAAAPRLCPREVEGLRERLREALM